MTVDSIPWTLEWHYGNSGTAKDYIAGTFGPIHVDAEYSAITDDFNDDGPACPASWVVTYEYTDAGGVLHDRATCLFGAQFSPAEVEYHAKFFAISLIEGGLLDMPTVGGKI